MNSHLTIDLSKCVGCTACASVCIRRHIAIELGHPAEVDSELPCMDCGHCAAVCPAEAISLTRYPGFVPETVDSKDIPVTEEGYLRMLDSRRSVRWFTRDPVTDDDFERLLSAARCSPSVENSQDVEFAVVSDRFGPFMRHIAGIVEPLKGEVPRFRQLVDHVNDPFPMGPNPLTWEGRQLVLAFANHPEDACIAMARVELMAQVMGLGCFYSHWIRRSHDEDRARFMEFFPDVPADKVLGAVLVIGHPRVRYRRTVPRDAPVIHRYRGEAWTTTAR